MQPFRVPSRMAPTAYKTYALSLPATTHWRTATCAEVECDAYVKGWQTVVDISTEVGQKQSAYITRSSGRSWVREINGSMITYVFAPGQKCFREHHLPLEREPLYVVRDGDHRGNPTGRSMLHSGAQAWIDDFGEHQQNIAEEIERG